MLEEYPVIKGKLLRFFGFDIDKEPFFKGSKEKWRICRQTWQSLSKSELQELENELPTAEQFTSGNKKEAAYCRTVFTTNFLVTNRIIGAEGVWPVRFRDMLWVYKHILTHRTNFIPTSVTVSIYMYDRYGRQYCLLESGSKVLKSEHEELDGAFQALADRVRKIRPGLLTGYSEEWENKRSRDFSAFVEMCDTLNSRMLQQNSRLSRYGNRSSRSRSGPGHNGLNRRSQSHRSLRYNGQSRSAPNRSSVKGRR